MSGNNPSFDSAGISSPKPKRFKRSKRSLLAPYVEKESVNTVVESEPVVEAELAVIAPHVDDLNDAIAQAQPDPRMDDELAEDNASIINDTDNTSSAQVDDRSDTAPLVSFELVNAPEHTYSEKFLRHIIKADFNFTHNLMDMRDIPPINDEIDNAFEGALTTLIKKAKPDSKVSVSIDNAKLVKNIYLPPVDVSLFKKENFLNNIALVYQSNKEFILDGVLKVTVYVLDKLQGSGRTNTLPQTYEDCRERKNSIVKINNNDASCGLRALFVGKTWIDLCPDLEVTTEWKSFINNKSSMESKITTGARQLSVMFDLSMNDPLTIDDIDTKIQPLWSGEYQIFIVNGVSGELLYKGPFQCNKHIYLLWTSNDSTNRCGHYDTIKNIRILFNARKWCPSCYKFFQTTARHHCLNGCYVCRSSQKCIADDTKQVCGVCHRTFLNQVCFETHLNNMLCKELQFCEECEVSYRVVKNQPHECDVRLCRDCKERYRVIPHECMLKTLSAEKLVEEDQIPKIINVFDIESMLLKDDSVEKHEPNLVCSMTVCDSCTDEKLKNPTFNCVFCGILYQKFEGQTCINSFVTHVCDELAQRAHAMGGHVLSIAHNFSGYDGAFVFKCLLDQQIKNIKPILNGSKLMKIDVGNVRFLDSLLFFQLPLSKLPSAFGIANMSKGYFPHHINNPENQNMSDCPISDIDERVYGIETMSESSVKTFREWYSSQVQSNSIFQFWPELEKYCKNDASILLQAVLSFKKYFKQLTSLDPVTRCFTLPSVGLEDFKSHHLEENSITVTPVNGFSSKRNSSSKEAAWISFQEKMIFKYTIVRDYPFGSFRADGMYCKPYEMNGVTYDMAALFFDGCYFHGCNTCKRGETDAQKEKRENRERYFQKRNICLIVEKECHFDANYYNSSDEDIKKFIRNRMKVFRLLKRKDLYVYPRKALHGGRTNNIKFYAKANSNESLHYYDFTSLYPWVLKNHSFPMREPVTVYDFDMDMVESIKSYNGLISAKVLPPRRLRFPVLPFNCNNKLMFPLCRTCAIEQKHDDCQHTVVQRQFTGVFTSAELHKAVDRGYIIKAIYEVTHFKEWSDNVFKDYINKWYKIKAEASGWPKNITTDVQKDEWIDEMKRKEGINIEKEKVVFNPGMRFISKLMLNSLWGKLAQRPNRPQTRIVKTYDELWKLFNDDRLEILGEYTVGEMILVNYRYINDAHAPAGQTCSAIASFVTAYARLKLLDEIEKIENDNPGSVVYFDTDSVVFSWKEGCYKPFVGNFLGEMTDEVVEEYGAGAKLTAFYTTGPKSYCTKVEKPNASTATGYETVYKMKTKGLTQIYAAKEELNPVTLMKHAVFKAIERECEPVLVPQCQFRRHPKQGFSVTTNYIHKVFRNTSNKRRIIGNDTVPFGFITSPHIPIEWSRVSTICKKWYEEYGPYDIDHTCGNVKCRKCVKRREKCNDYDCEHPDCVRLYHFHR